MRQIQAFRFCPRCGNSFKKHDTFLECPSCGLNFYINPKSCTAIMLVNENGEFLLVKRAFEPAKGSWDLPGGFVEENESLEENARRELQEELGIEVGELHYVGSATEPYLFQKITYPTVAACFVAKAPINAVLKPADDVTDYKFFAPDKLPMKHLGFKSMAKDFQAAKKFLMSNPL